MVVCTCEGWGWEEIEGIRNGVYLNLGEGIGDGAFYLFLAV